MTDHLEEGNAGGGAASTAPVALVHATLDGRRTGVIAVRREDNWESLFVFVDAELRKRLEYV